MRNTPNAMNTNRLRTPRLTSARRGFTLIEILVALGIFSILLTIIMVPLNMGVNLTRIGSARTDTQQAAQAMMNRIVTDLRAATYVFPNQPMPGITDKAPYTNNPFGAPARTAGYPYFRAPLGTEDVCGTADVPFANTSRIDFLKPVPPETVPHSISSFYTARADTTVPWDSATGNAYDAELNPVVMYAAQTPYEFTDGTANQFQVNSKPNALLGQKRIASPSDCTSDAANINQGARWLMHNGAGEPFLALQPDPRTSANPVNPALQDDLSATASTDPASNVRITPKGVGLYAPQADNAPSTNLQDNLNTGRMFTPATTFICEDTNANGIIDRVTVTLVMGKYDGAGAENRAQSVRLVQTVDLPNVESRFSNSR